MQRKGEPEKYKEMVYLILYKGKCKQKKKRVITIYCCPMKLFKLK